MIPHLLARGWSSTVYRGTTDGGAPAVLKVRHPSIPGFTSDLDRGQLDDAWQREQEALLALRNVPGVVRLLAVVDGASLLLRHEPGRTLTRWVAEQGVLTVADARRVASCVARVLVEIHARRWLHGDLNPGNILFDGVTTTMLDFGAARQIGSCADWSWPLGRHVFLAPETLSCVERVPTPLLTTASDVHQLGCLVAFLITGRHPFRGCDESEDYRDEYLWRVLDWSRRDGAVKARAVLGGVADLEPEILNFISYCLDPDERARPSVEQCLALLKEI